MSIAKVVFQVYFGCTHGQVPVLELVYYMLSDVLVQRKGTQLARGALAAKKALKKLFLKGLK